MTIDTRNNLILQLQYEEDIPTINNINKFNSATQTYYSNEKEALQNCPQPIKIKENKLPQIDNIEEALKKVINMTQAPQMKQK